MKFTQNQAKKIGDFKRVEKKPRRERKITIKRVIYYSPIYELNYI